MDRRRKIHQMKNLAPSKPVRFRSLTEFVDSTKDKTIEQTKAIALAEYAIAGVWLDYLRQFPQYEANQDYVRMVDYFDGLQRLLGRLERRPKKRDDYIQQQIERGLEQWSRNTKRD